MLLELSHQGQSYPSTASCVPTPQQSNKNRTCQVQSGTAFHKSHHEFSTCRYSNATCTVNDVVAYLRMQYGFPEGLQL